MRGKDREIGIYYGCIGVGNDSAVVVNIVLSWFIPDFLQHTFFVALSFPTPMQP
jgi:hypothetical protein